MVESNMVDGGHLRAFVERIERLESERRAIADDLKDEEWRLVIGFSDYEVSSVGRVRCATRRRYLNPGDLISLHVAVNGYILACIDGKNRGVHRLVCHAFHGNPPSTKHEAAHNDGIRSNNRPGNLRWATHKENCADKKIHGTENPPRGERQGRSKLRTEDVKSIRERIALGDSVMAISREFGVSHGAIGLIKSGRNWAHV